MPPSNGRSKEKKANQGRRKPKAREKNFQDEKNAESALNISREVQPSLIPTHLQQTVLDVFSKSFGTQDADELRQRIQKVKGSLYNRNFDAAFESAENQEAYCLRWSPSRALAYTELLCSIPDTLEFLKHSQLDSSADASTNITCVGGGAGAETVAFAAALRYVTPNAKSEHETSHSEGGAVGDVKNVRLNAIDIADWSPVLSKLDAGINEHLYDMGTDGNGRASPSLLPNNLPRTARFKHANILNLATSDLSIILHPPLEVQALPTDSNPSPTSPPSLTPPPTLITILFTLNELYTTSLSATTSLLLNLTTLTARGALLLVVDSPGSYSTITLGGAEKRYPMQWLLDHTLLTQASKLDSLSAENVQGRDESARAKTAEMAKWEKVSGEESRWWRMDRTALRYRVPGVELEDMRMQWHLFRRV